MTTFWFTVLRISVIAAESLCCELMYAGLLKRKKYFPLRFLLCLGAIFGFSTLLADINQKILVALGGEIYAQAVASLLSVFFIFLSTVVTFFISFTGKSSRIAACCVFGYCTRHLIFSVYTLVVKLMGEEYVLLNYAPVTALKFVMYFVICVPLYIAIWFCFARNVNKHAVNDIGNNGFILFVVMLLMNVLIGQCCEVCGAASLVLYALCLICQIALCLLILFIQIFLIEDMRVKYEKRITEQLLQQKMEQYDAFKRNAELLNIKVHDLKYQLAAMKNGNASPDDISETEELIKKYEGMVLTDNQLLNTILSEKQIICREKNIRFSCIADGNAAPYVSPAEMYALLGNALDNAIEAVEKCAEQSHRVISMTMRSQQGVALIEVNNYYEGELREQDGTFESSKTDGGVHGYGIKSIKSIVKKHGGSVDIRTNDGIFTISIAIPDEG